VVSFFSGGGGEAAESEAYLEFQAALWAARNLAIFFASAAWPLVQSYSNPFPALWSNADALCSLDTLLKDIVCITYFRNYLASINRVEWILAWVEMELFKDFDAPDVEGEGGEGGGDGDGEGGALAEQAKRIYAKYVQLGAELEVHFGSGRAKSRAPPRVRWHGRRRSKLTAPGQSIWSLVMNAPLPLWHLLLRPRANAAGPQNALTLPDCQSITFRGP